MKKYAILVVDDEAAIRQFLEENLACGGYRVLSAASVDEAISMLVSHSDISLIICDIAMPKRDGFDLIRYINDNLRFTSIPLIFSTGKTDAQTVSRAKALGARGFLAKPFTGQELRKRVTNALDSGKGTVLIVSSDQLSLNIMARNISVARYKSLTAPTIADAHALLNDKQIDILISELQLSDGSGLELMASAKESVYKIPVLIITGKPDVIVEEQLITAGADAIIRRPFSNIDIISKIEAILLNQRNNAIHEIDYAETNS